MSTVIKVENLYKQYRLGEVGTGSMKDDFIRWRYKMMGKEDPFLTVGDENDRAVKSSSKYVWALKDINFEVKEGEILGIIGKNGAGKSTLLKILSRTTGPTKGSVKMKGKIASLLEVGTGFHGELSGRENIYLNGAIMGMTKTEIKRKLDEIIDFAGVEKYIDTPVKRYSSGMYVRLAFGVAAHLEPDIMIVDEVLAVGDAEFQKKAIGKMKDVSTNSGRTVLFVSHNIAAVQKLCNKGLLLKNGYITYDGNIKNVIDKYIADNDTVNEAYFKNDKVKEDSDIIEIKILNDKNKLCSLFKFDEQIKIAFTVKIATVHLNATLGFRVKDQFERNIFTSEIKIEDFVNEEGSFTFSADLPRSILAPNNYQILAALHVVNTKILSSFEAPVGFAVEETGSKLIHYNGTDYGCVLIDCKWIESLR